MLQLTTITINIDWTTTRKVVGFLCKIINFKIKQDDQTHTSECVITHENTSCL